MRVVVATHGHCFDGLCSAVAFSRLLQRLEGAGLRFEYRSCGYGINQRPVEGLFDGDHAAVLDYRFSPSEKLTWYFDHHRTAFASDQDREVYGSREDRGRYFFDPAYSSCSQLIADTAKRQLGVNLELDELVRWADRVDAARFDSPEDAIDRTDPIMRLVSVTEHYADDHFLARLVPELLERPLQEVAESRFIQDRYRPLGKKHEAFVERVRHSAESIGRVVFVDLTESVVDAVGKFVTYALFPRSVYSVIIGRLATGVKVSIGYNPWSGQALDTDISAICARHGGGGHPVVGGISFRTEELARALEISRGIAVELAG